MRKLPIYLIYAVLILSACGGRKNDVQNGNPGAVPRSFADPSNISGLSFGNFMQKLHQEEKFDDMVRFTSSASVNKFGYDQIMHYYRTMEFDYDLSLKFAIDGDNGVVILNYSSSRFSENETAKMNVVIENDSVKVVLTEKMSLME